MVLAYLHILSISSDRPHYVQELLDVRQKQRNGAQIVQEIRKQADDVLFFTFVL